MSDFSRGFQDMLMRLAGFALVISLTAVLGGCGSGAVSSDGVAVSSTPTMVISLTELTTTTARTAIAFGNPAKVNVTIKSGSTPVVGVVVTFTTDLTLGTLIPTSGTALTDANGVASVTLSAASFSASGAGTVSAAAQVTTGTAPVSLSQSIGYSVGAANVTISPVSIQSPALSAFGTTAVTVTVSSGGQPTTVPLEVKFTSPCALSGKAALTAAATTVSGVASATYRDIGCAAADTITATVSGTTLSSTGVVTSAPPAVGSIQFVSARPTSIALRGTGGVGRQETSLVTFKVVDVAGNPVGGRLVQFELNTTAGGLTITPGSAISDSATGIAVTTVGAGSVSTPVRVTARTVSGGQTLSTQSDQLSISTGVPSQGGFSLSVSTFNIEGGSIDGVATQITARLADRFSNPVPDGTVVNFTSAGGSIGSTCTTAAGVCSSTLTSQNFRPANGRVAILAYAIGEESFTDRNGNGWFDITPISELVDLNGAITDLPEAWLDVNENGRRDSRSSGDLQDEPFIDFNNDGVYNGGDGKFNGVSCNENIVGGSAAGSCGAQKSIHVRGQTVVVFSGSVPVATGSNASGFDRASVAFAPCNPSTVSPTPIGVLPAQTAIFTVRDTNGNVLPAGTTVVFTTTNGTIPTTSTSTYTVPNTNARVVAGAADGYGNFAVTIQSDVTQVTTISATTTTYSCANIVSSGTLTATVKTPSGRTTTFSIPVTD